MAMLDGIKSRLGLSKEDESRGRTRDRNGRGYDDYDDGYDDYGYDDGYQGDYDDGYDDAGNQGGYDDGYQPEDDQYSMYAPVTTRTPGRSTSSSRSATTPRLVSFDDVKAQTAQMTADRYAASTQRKAVAADETGSIPMQRERSEGLNSLFEPSASGSSRTTVSERRTVSVIAPMIYNDVANVASIVRAGNVAVLDLAKTPDSLRNRVLDFSFGVASALEAQVDSPAQNVYSIAKGDALTNVEKSTLKARGVL